MKTIRMALVSSRAGAVLVACAASTTALVLGCAPLEDEAADESHSAGAVSTSTRPLPDEHPEGVWDHASSTDKALAQDYCCVAKKGDRVKSCINVYGLKAGVGLSCGAVLSDNVVRGGRCEKYASCAGKIRERAPVPPAIPDPPGFPNGF